MILTSNEPRLRVNRDTSLLLSTTFQDIDFNGVSDFNVNTFGIDPVSGEGIVEYDSATKLFKFHNQYDRNFLMNLYASTTTTTINTRATIQYRINIPDGISAGVDINFPFPDGLGLADLAEVTLRITETAHKSESIPIYASQVLRDNGFKVQMRLSNLLAVSGTSTLNSASILIQ